MANASSPLGSPVATYSRREIRCAEQHIPPRQHGTVIATTPPERQHAVMRAMKPRRDQQTLAHDAERDPGVGMRQALDEAQHQHQQRKLHRRHADRQRNHAEPQERNEIVQQVIAVVRPERHLALRVMHRMQRPPPAEHVRHAVPPIVGKVQNDGVDRKGQHRMAEQRREHPLQHRRDPAVIGEPAVQRHLHLIEQHERHQRQHARRATARCKRCRPRRPCCPAIAQPAASAPAADRSPGSAPPAPRRRPRTTPSRARVPPSASSPERRAPG